MADNKKTDNTHKPDQSENTAACSINLEHFRESTPMPRSIEVKNSMPPPPNPKRNEDNNEP